LIIRKIITIVATSKSFVGWLSHRPRWGSLQRSHRLHSWILGAYLEGREGEGTGGELTPLISRYTPATTF